MAKDKNIFGGANANSLYRPMSEIEQELLDRLIATQDLRVEVLEWGYVEHPQVRHGDARLQIQWKMPFSAPAEPQEVWHFDLELRTRSGILLYRERQPTIIDSMPLVVQAGMAIDLIWDIQIAQMDPKLVKTLMPRVTGLTTRRGNERFTPEQAQLAHNLAMNERFLKTVDPQKVRSVMAKLRKGQHGK